MSSNNMWRPVYKKGQDTKSTSNHKTYLLFVQPEVPQSPFPFVVYIVMGSSRFVSRRLRKLEPECSEPRGPKAVAHLSAARSAEKMGNATRKIGPSEYSMFVESWTGTDKKAMTCSSFERSPSVNPSNNTGDLDLSEQNLCPTVDSASNHHPDNSNLGEGSQNQNRWFDLSVARKPRKKRSPLFLLC
jgi:hypothetical protein